MVDNPTTTVSSWTIPGGPRRWIFYVVCSLLLFARGLLSVAGSSNRLQSNELEYCSFFNNRAPQSQPNLRNCTWYRKKCCCMQQEIDATFGKVKPLPGASPLCQTYINYLMCYICSPSQYKFYSREQLVVCEEFCDALYGACTMAVLKGSAIKDLYSNGSEFCLNRRFEVARRSGGKCFYYDSELTDLDGVSKLHSLSAAVFLFPALIYWWISR